MKAQYFGDVNDYRKFALLRLLAEVGGFKIGVCWMMTEDDGAHGAKRQYLKRPDEWKAYDSKVYETLSGVSEKPTLGDLQGVEANGLITSATYFEEFTPDDKLKRADWHARCLKSFEGAELAFFDPDNGLEIKNKRRGHKRSNKYSFVDELAKHYRAGRSILVYQHYPMNKSHARARADACGRLRDAMPGAMTTAFKTPFVAFLLASRPEHEARVAACVTEVQRREWPPKFIDPEVVAN